MHFLSQVFIALQIILLQEQSSPTSVCCLLAWSKGVWISQKMHLRGHPSPSSPTPVVTCAPGICSLILPWSSNHLRLSCLPLPSVWAVFLPAQINRTHRGRSVVHFPPSFHEVINSHVRNVCSLPMSPAHHTCFSCSKCSIAPDSLRQGFSRDLTEACLLVGICTSSHK